MKPNHGAQYEISIDGVPRTYRDRQDPLRTLVASN
jgi:hypothetical protein